MAKVKFYRGAKAGYALLSNTVKRACIYFTTDTNEIIVDGNVYGDRDIENIIVPVQIDEVSQIKIPLVQATLALSEALFEMGEVVNNRQEKLIAGANVNISNGNVISVESIQESYLNWGGVNRLNYLSPIDSLLDEYHIGNRFASFAKARKTVPLTREISNDGGLTWQTVANSDTANKQLFIGDTGIQADNLTTGGLYNVSQAGSGNNQARITAICKTANGIDGSNVAFCVNKIILALNKDSYINDSTPIRDFVKLECANSNGQWTTIVDWSPIRGYPGYTTINFPEIRIADANTSYWQMRFTIKGACSVAKILGFGSYTNIYYSNLLSTYGRPYSVDTNGNAAFMGTVTQGSDIRLKTNIVKLTDNADMPNIYEFDMKETGEHAYGVIAQELEKNYPELVLTSPDNVIIDPETNKEIKREAGYKSVKYWETHSMMLAKLCNKIKQLENEIAELKNIQQESEVNDETE